MPGPEHGPELLAQLQGDLVVARRIAELNMKENRRLHIENRELAEQVRKLQAEISGGQDQPATTK